MEVVSRVMTRVVNPLDLARLRRDKVISFVRGLCMEWISGVFSSSILFSFHGGTYQYNWYHR